MHRLIAAMILLLTAIHSTDGGADELRVGVNQLASSADPHFSNDRAGVTLARHLFDPLLSRSPDLALEPRLAISWKPLDSRTWEFHLRPNVLFYQGHTLTTRDVIYTFCRILNQSNNPVRATAALDTVTDVKAVGPLVLRVHTSRPNPYLPDRLAEIAIVPASKDFRGELVQGRCEAADWRDRAHFDWGEVPGTGPFRLEFFRPGGPIVIRRNPDHWGDPAPWTRVTFRSFPNGGARSRALIGGDVDVIEIVEPRTLERLRSQPGIQIVSRPSTTVTVLQLDAMRESAAGIGGTEGRNPLKDPKVRQALSLAIDRDGMVRRLLEGKGIPTSQFQMPGGLGHIPDLPMDPYDPPEARRLLAEAGWADGFALTLLSADGWTGRQAEVVAQFLSAVGVRTTIRALPRTELFRLLSREPQSAVLAGWVASSRDLSYTLSGLFLSPDPEHGRGTANFGRWSDPVLDQLYERAMDAEDEETRGGLLREAARRVAELRPVLALYIPHAQWALRAGLRYEGRADDMTLVQEIRPVAVSTENPPAE